MESPSADFNGDGTIDARIANLSLSGGPSMLQRLPGDATEKRRAALASAVNLTATIILEAELNRDSKADTALAGQASGGPVLAVLESQGYGTLGLEQDHALPGTPVSVAVGDFDGDGLPDVAVGVKDPNGSSTGVGGEYVLRGNAGHPSTIPPIPLMGGGDERPAPIRSVHQTVSSPTGSSDESAI